MKLQDQVCDEQQAIKLKELGVKQDAIWFWAFPIKEKMISTRKGIIHNTTCEDILRDNDGDEFDHDVAAAFTVAELGVMLPAGYDTMYCTGEGWRGYDLASRDMLDSNTFYTEAECRAAMLIHLIETKVVTPEEVNARLCS